MKKCKLCEDEFESMDLIRKHYFREHKIKLCKINCGQGLDCVICKRWV